MESEARYTLVGLVTLGLAALFAAGIIWLTDFARIRDRERYQILLEQHSGRGLNIGAPVTFHGIPIGRVADLGISREDIAEIEVLVEVKRDSPIKVDTRARVERNFLTGEAWIDLVGGTQQAPPLEAASPGPGPPTIPEGRPGLEQIESTLPEVIASIQKVLENVAGFLSEENQAKLAAILDDLAEVTGEFSDGDGSLARISGLAAGVLVETTELVRELRAAAGSFERTADETLSALSSRLALAADEIARAARTFAVVMERYENPRALFLGPPGSELGPGEE